MPSATSTAKPRLPTLVSSLITDPPSSSSKAQVDSGESHPTQPNPQKTAETQAQEIISDITQEVTIPPDTARMKNCIGGTTEELSRQLFARLANYQLDVVQLAVSGKAGDCLFKSVLHSLPHPDWYTVKAFRLEVAWFLVKNVTLVQNKLKPMLISQGISFYTMCRRIVLSEEWGGLETLLMIRWQWKVPLTVVCPGHDQEFFHNLSVAHCPLVLAYNGSNHYMPTGQLKRTHSYETIESSICSLNIQ